MLNGGGWLWCENFVVSLHYEYGFVFFGMVCVVFYKNICLINRVAFMSFCYLWFTTYY